MGLSRPARVDPPSVDGMESLSFCRMKRGGRDRFGRLGLSEEKSNSIFENRNGSFNKQRRKTNY